LPEELGAAELEFNLMQIISREERSCFNASDKGKVYFSLIKGINIKFKAIKTVGLDNISTISNISSFAKKRLNMQKHIKSVSAHPVFLIIKVNKSGNLINPDTAKGNSINILFTNFMPTLECVEQSTFFHYKRDSISNQENLIWNIETIRNSCDRD
jgi:hypothetical protein